MPIVTFNAFDVDRVPFPFTDRNSAKNRPALVLSDEAAFNAPAGHSVMAMITSVANAPWPLDCGTGDLSAAGLPSPSKVRFKLFTLDHRGAWPTRPAGAGGRSHRAPGARRAVQSQTMNPLTSSPNVPMPR